MLFVFIVLLHKNQIISGVYNDMIAIIVRAGIDGYWISPQNWFGHCKQKGDILLHNTQTLVHSSK